MAHLKAWGEDGLRTLCFAYRRIPDDEYVQWLAQYNAALRNDDEKAKFDRKILPNAIDEAMDLLETNLILQVRHNSLFLNPVLLIASRLRLRLHLVFIYCCLWRLQCYA
jgi:hypothetical protein